MNIDSPNAESSQSAGEANALPISVGGGGQPLFLSGCPSFHRWCRGQEGKREEEVSGSKESLGDIHLCALHLVDIKPVTYTAVLVRSPFGCR